MRSAPKLSVVIPTHNGAATFAQCLEAIRASSLVPHEIIVVDDASTDDSGGIAGRFDCRVIRLGDNVGAARAKNVGAQNATGDILFFTDDDVMVAPNALERMAADFADASVAGVVGLFTPEIPFENFASQFKNHWMLYTYVRLPRDRIGVFYTSVAAIRREVFAKLCGFDENYRGVSIAEDTEFGQRAWRAGHKIILDPAVRATHAKHYTARQVLQTDLRRARALTLMRLRKLGQPFFTSVPLFYQLAVPTIFLTLGLLGLGLFADNGLSTFAGVVSVLVFYLLFSPWFLYLFSVFGEWFTLRALLFQPFDAIAVGVGMLNALSDFGRGVRY